MTHTTQVLSDEQHKTAIEQLETAAGQFENAATVPNAPGSKEYAEKARQIRASIATLKAVSGQEPFGYFRSMPFGWEDCAETDEGAVPLYALPPAQPAPVDDRAAALIKECADALHIELTEGWDIDPPLHHVKRAYDRCVAWLESHEQARAALQCAQAPQPTKGQP